MDINDMKGFFEGLSKTLTDAINGPADDDPEAKKAADEKAAEEKAAKEKAEKEEAEKKAADEKAAKAKAGEGGDTDDDPPELTKRIDDLEAALKTLTENSDAQREALEKALDTVAKLAEGTAVKKGLDIDDSEDLPTEDDMKKSERKDRQGLDKAVAAAAGGATVRLE